MDPLLIVGSLIIRTRFSNSYMLSVGPHPMSGFSLNMSQAAGNIFSRPAMLFSYIDRMYRDANNGVCKTAHTNPPRTARTIIRLLAFAHRVFPRIAKSAKPIAKASRAPRELVSKIAPTIITASGAATYLARGEVLLRPKANPISATRPRDMLLAILFGFCPRTEVRELTP